MIYTLTLNPSLDYVVDTKDLVVGQLNRAGATTILPGGKGVNVSIVLKNLGVDNTAILLTAGFTGRELINVLGKRKVNCKEIVLDEGMTRINVKIRSGESSDKKTETEVNASGPFVSNDDLQRIYKELAHLKAGDVLVLSGSAPASVSKSIYADIMEQLSAKDIKVVVDATGELLTNTLRKHPYLIKPNNYEIEEIFKVKISNEEELITYGMKLKAMGARNVLISLGADGALLITEDGMVYKKTAPTGKVRNTVGAGDSMVAGFVAHIDETFENALLYAIATGSASAFSEDLATKEEVDEIVKTLIKS